MRSRRIKTATALAALALALAATAAAAEAGPPGRWTKMTALDAPAQETDEVGLARTPNGVLHVLWTRAEAGGAGSVFHTSLSANARSRSARHPVAGYAGGVNNRPALIAVPGGLRAFFAGLQDGNPLSEAMATATSADGRAWAIQPTPASNGATPGRSPVYAGVGIGAALAGSVPVSAWGDSTPGAGGFHVGLGSSDPDGRFGPPCCVLDPNVGADAVSGRGVLAWNLVMPEHSETFVQPLGGARTAIPGSRAAQPQQRVGITGRSARKRGVYVAYTHGNNQFLGRPALFRVGDSRGRIVSRTPGAQGVNVAAAPGGRLWAFWWRDSRLHATRSDTSASRFGAVVSVKPPASTRSIHRLAGEGSRGPLDLLAHVTRRRSDVGSWHTRILPGLSLEARAGRGRLTVAVRDAGAKVRGARVKVGRRSGRTGRAGSASFALAKGRYEVVVSRKGYAEARARVRVK